MHPETQEEQNPLLEEIRIRMDLGFINEYNLRLGQIIPVNWFKYIRNENGKSNTIAVCVLAHLIFSYLKSRPSHITRDEIPILCLENNAFYITYKEISKSLCISAGQAKSAVVFLETLGLVKRIFKMVYGEYSCVGNILYFQLNADKISEITFDGED